MQEMTLVQRLKAQKVESKWSDLVTKLSGISFSDMKNFSGLIEELFCIYNEVYAECKMDTRDYSISACDPNYTALSHIYFAYHLLTGFSDRIKTETGKNIYVDNESARRFELRKGFSFGLVNHAMQPFRNKADAAAADLKYLRNFAYSLGYHNKAETASDMLYELMPKLMSK